MASRTLALVLVASLVPLAGCGAKPSEEQCQQFVAHLISLIEKSRDKPDGRIKQLARTYEDKMIEACVTEGTLREVECVLAQESLEDVESNCK